MGAHLTQLIPIQELSAGQVGAIRNSIIYGDVARGIEGLVDRVARELRMSRDNLVVRDIRPLADLTWGSGTTKYMATAIAKEEWSETTHASNVGFQDLIVGATNTVMDDQRFVAIWGLRDITFNLATAITPPSTLWKFDVGHSVKAIWDISKCYAYKYNVTGICPSAVIIPQNTYFNIYGYIINVGIESYVSLLGTVVEPRGLVVSP